MKIVLISIPLVLVISACASPNSRYVGLAPMAFDINERGPKEFFVVARGAGAHNAGDVQPGFDLRAKELCNGSEFTQDATTEPYTYDSSGGGNFYTHKAFRRAGTVKCS
jgi:hypothetical protein